MKELLNAAARFYWAMSLFGARQIGAASSRDGTDRTRRAFDSVTGATEEELGSMLKSAFEVGDRLQRGLCDLVPGLPALGSDTSRAMMRTTLNTAQQTAGALSALVPGVEARVALKEFQNKLEVFDWFENVDTIFSLPRGAATPLAELVAHTSGLDSFTAVWATEGIGHYYAETAWEEGAPRGLLQGGNAHGVPAKTLVALHAGMGISLANRLLRAVRSESRECQPPCDLCGALMQFVVLCRNNSAEGYVGAAYESLGLVARNLYPHMINQIHKHLPETGEDLTDYFWHGVGRAIYFAPTNYLPFGNASCRAVEMTRHEPPDERSRGNALAGLAWAQFLVNLRHPEIIETLLTECKSALEAGAFANGISSATVIWCDSTEHDPHLGALCKHRPDSSVAESWRELVEMPCRCAIDEYYYILKEHDCVGEIFRVRALPQFMRELKGQRKTVLV